MDLNAPDPDDTNNAQALTARSPVIQTVSAGVMYAAADEIDLVDLGVLLWRRRWLMLWAFLVFAVLTVVVTIFKSPAYEYSTTLQLGTVVGATGNVAPLMSAQDVAKTLADTYLPAAGSEYVSKNHLDPETAEIPKISAVGDPNGSNVVMSCRAKPALGPVCTAVEQIAADNFIQANSRFITAAQNQLASLKSQAKVLQVQLDKLDASATLYQQQAKSLQRQIERMQNAGIAAARGASTGSAALSNLILNTEVQHAMDSLSTVQQNLDVTIPQQRAQFSQQLSDNLHAQQLQQLTIDQGYIRTLSPGLRSLKPVSLSRIAMLAIGILLSIVLAFIAAFAASFVAQVRLRLSTGTQN